MNGFIIFDQDDAADRFAKVLGIADTGLLRRLVRSTRKPLFTFCDFDATEVSRVRRLAENDGGEIRESVKYAALRGLATS